MGRSIALLTAAALLAAAVLAPSAGALDLDALIASPSACPGQTELDASLETQRQAMLCMTNFARHQVGQAGFREAAELDRSALRKSGDILHCNSFSHYACGREFTYWMQRSGYLSAGCWRAAENIAWGTGSLGTVRAIFSAWIHSPGHRENILGRYSQIGIGLQEGALEGHEGARVWTQHFGSHC